MIRKYTTRILSCLLATLCIINFLPNIVYASTNGHTRDEAVAWAKSKLGQYVYNGQCVGLIYEYLDYLGHSELRYYNGNSANGGRNACDFANASLPSGWTYVYSNYKPGDIAVFKTNVAPYTGSLGHVGIITYADADCFKIINQNYSEQHFCTENEFKYYVLGCAIRPDFSDNPIPVSVSWAASSYMATEIREGKILISKDAVLNGTVMDNVSLIGIDVYDASGNRVGGKSEEPYRGSVTHVDIWYDFSEELGLPITPGTVYKYKFWVQINNKKYYSDEATVTCPPVYTVSFNSNGGSSVSDLKIGKNQTIKTLPTTTRSGYVFDGWYTSASGGIKLTTSTAITGNTTYYAHWIEEVKFIKSQPSDFTGTTGGTATFKVVAQGTGLKYQWQTNSNGSWVNSSLPGYNTATLSVPITTSRNGYKFRCVVTDSSNKTETSNTATLHAAAPVSITTQPKDYTGTVGSTATFTVVAKGAGLKYQWQTYSNGAWKNSSLTGSTTATLSVPVITSRNGYKFRCVVTDAGNNTYVSNTATLRVTAYTAVSITTQPKDYTGTVGTTATFKVVAKGTGLKYQWQTYSNGAWKNSSLTGYNTATLSVPVVASRNGYKFRCVVTDASNKSVTTNAVTLKVVVPTALTITGQPGNYTGPEGTTATFKVVAQGTGLRYQWQTYSNGAWKNSSLPGYNTATLSVPVIASRNGYKFRCVITDSSNKTATSNTVVLRVAT